MPPFYRTCPNAVAVQCVATLEQQFVENTFYYLGSAPADGGTVQALADLVDTVYNTTVMPLLVSDVGYDKTVCTALDTPTAPQYVTITNQGNSGGDLTKGLPSSVAFAITRYTALRGRSYRGRNYVFGIPEAKVIGRTLDLTYSAALVAAFESVDAACATLGFAPAVISWTQNGVRSDPGIATVVLGRRLYDLIVDTQRRRLH